MPYCKHCNEFVSASATSHNCRKVGLLNVQEDNSFLVSAIIGAATDSAIMGGLLGGDMLGGMIGDLLDGDLMD
jgi:hypothetical protein